MDNPKHPNKTNLWNQVLPKPRLNRFSVDAPHLPAYGVVNEELNDTDNKSPIKLRTPSTNKKVKSQVINDLVVSKNIKDTTVSKIKKNVYNEVVNNNSPTVRRIASENVSEFVPMSEHEAALGVIWRKNSSSPKQQSSKDTSFTSLTSSSKDNSDKEDNRKIAYEQIAQTRRPSVKDAVKSDPINLVPINDVEQDLGVHWRASSENNTKTNFSSNNSINALYSTSDVMHNNLLLSNNISNIATSSIMNSKEDSNNNINNESQLDRSFDSIESLNLNVTEDSNSYHIDVLKDKRKSVSHIPRIRSSSVSLNTTTNIDSSTPSIPLVENNVVDTHATTTKDNGIALQQTTTPDSKVSKDGNMSKSKNITQLSYSTPITIRKSLSQHRGNKSSTSNGLKSNLSNTGTKTLSSSSQKNTLSTSTISTPRDTILSTIRKKSHSSQKLSTLSKSHSTTSNNSNDNDDVKSDISEDTTSSSISSIPSHRISANNQKQSNFQYNNFDEYSSFIISKNEIQLYPVPIGEGFFGVVYRAKWNDIDIAAKKIKHNNGERNEFLSEVSSLAKFRHPNIVLFYGITSPPNPYIISELLSCSLHQLIHYDKMTNDNNSNITESITTLFPITIVLRILKDIAAGGHYLHSRNPSVIHRDLSTSNVLLSMSAGSSMESLVAACKDESRPFAKLTDFGLSRDVDRYMTACVGNCLYLAPEIFAGEKYTESADIFSYGMIIWELLTRKYLHADLPPQKVAFLACTQNLRPIYSDSELVPLELKELSMLSWSSDAKLRPSFFEILRTLKDFELQNSITVIEGEEPIDINSHEDIMNSESLQAANNVHIYHTFSDDKNDLELKYVSIDENNRLLISGNDNVISPSERSNTPSNSRNTPSPFSSGKKPARKINLFI